MRGGLRSLEGARGFCQQKEGADAPCGGEEGVSDLWGNQAEAFRAS